MRGEVGGWRKRRGPLWRVSIETTSEAEEAVTELLQEFFGGGVSSYTAVETGVVTVMVYFLAIRSKSHQALECADPPALPNYRPREKRRRAAALQDAGALKEALQNIKDCGLDIGSGRISIKPVRREDWAESWKRHFKPIEIGSALLIKPSWSRRAAKKGQAAIVLDPGLSFGTGQHPTTDFCLQQLVRNRGRHGENMQPSFLDIGTGSGILAIAAAKLGYAPVEAFDFDAEAVRIARDNARRNGASRKVNIRREDVTKMPLRSKAKYDLVCANLISTLLLAERQRIISRVKTDGTLVLAGILKSEFPCVQTTYERCGFRLVASRAEKEWRSGAFRFRN